MDAQSTPYVTYVHLQFNFCFTNAFMRVYIFSVHAGIYKLEYTVSLSAIVGELDGLQTWTLHYSVYDMYD